MGLFSFIFYKEYYYFLVFWIIDVIISIIKNIFNEFYKKFNGGNTNLGNYIYLINLCISDLLSGFLVLITIYRSKSEKKEEEKKTIINENQNKIKLIYNDLSKKKYTFSLILLSSLLDFVGNSASFLYHLFFQEEGINEEENKPLEGNTTLWFLSIDILSRIFFSRIILNSPLYKHHKLSTIIFIIGFIPIIIIGIIKMDPFLERFLFLLPRNIIQALDDILSKILLTYKFVIPQNLMFYRGIIYLIINLLLFPCLFFTHSFKDTTYFNEQVGLKIIFLLVYILLISIKRFCIMKVIYIFTPQHVCFLNVVITLINFIISLFCLEHDLTMLTIIFIILSLLIIIIGTLIFNEMIILNFSDLNKNTKTQILDREKKEKKFNVLSESFNDDENDNNETIVN